MSLNASPSLWLYGVVVGFQGECNCFLFYKSVASGVPIASGSLSPGWGKGVLVYFMAIIGRVVVAGVYSAVYPKGLVIFWIYV